MRIPTWITCLEGGIFEDEDAGEMSPAVERDLKGESLSYISEFRPYERYSSTVCLSPFLTVRFTIPHSVQILLRYHSSNLPYSRLNKLLAMFEGPSGLKQ